MAVILGQIIRSQSSEGGTDIYRVIISFHVRSIPDNPRELWEKY
jgi:hypothetical protein